MNEVEEEKRVVLNAKTHKRLARIGSKGDEFDKIISDLVNGYERAIELLGILKGEEITFEEMVNELAKKKFTKVVKDE